METSEQDEVIVGDVEENNETVEENTEETTPKVEKPKRTPQEEIEYFEGRAARLRKKHGLDKPEVKDSSKPNELDNGSIALLHSMVGLKGKDEIALARQYLANGKDILDLPDNKFFNQDLQALREARETANAVPKGKNRSSQAGINDIDFAVAKYKETGELPDDFATRNKVIDAITAAEVTPLFQGPSVRTS